MNTSSQPMRVLLAADHRYVIPLAVTLASISAFHDHGEVRVTVVSDGISFGDQDRIRLSAPSLEIEFEPIDDLFKGSLSRYKNLYPKSYYSRLLGLQYLSASEQRAIYLDSDIIAQSNLKALFDIDLTSFAVGAVRDNSIPHVSSRWGLRMWREIGMEPRLPYLNSGVLLVDLVAWRRLNLSEAILKFINENKHQFVFHDQDGFNAILQGEFHQLPLQWNQQTALRDGRHQLFPVADLDDIDSAIKDPKLIHFTEGPKPWQRRCRNPRKELWWEYLKTTDFANYKLPPLFSRQMATRVASRVRSEMAKIRE